MSSGSPRRFSRLRARVRRWLGRERNEPIAPARAVSVNDEQELETAIDALFVDLHRLCGADRVDRAALRLETFLRLHGHRLDARIHQRLGLFQDKRLMLQHSWHYMNRLLADGKPLRAWHLARESLDVDAAFRPGSADDLLALIRAAPPSDAHYVERLLGDFERAYPNDARLPDVLFEHAQCALRLGARDTALSQLARIEAEFPQQADTDPFRAFAARARRSAPR